MDGRRILAVALGATLVIGAIGFAVGQSISRTDDVHIIARQLADERIEFGLEQDGEIIQPRSRFFPPDAPVGRWLKSSPIEIAVESPTPLTEWQSIDPDVYEVYGTGSAYVLGGNMPKGNYICQIDITGNSTPLGFGAAHFAVKSFSADGSAGWLHANGIAESWSGSSRLAVGVGWIGTVQPGKVYFEVTAEIDAEWSISCERQ